MREYEFSKEYVLYELPESQGWALYAWSVENGPWNTADRITDGYVRQEVLSRIKTRPKRSKRRKCRQKH
jgi:hypothetical protein